MAREEIITGLKNALDRGQTLEKAIQIKVIKYLVNTVTNNTVEIGSSPLRIANVWLSKNDSLHIGNVGISENFVYTLRFIISKNNGIIKNIY